MPSEYRLASWALERAAERLGVTIEKALNPLDAADFVVIIARLASALRGATKGAEAEALRTAIGLLDVDWPNLNGAQKYRVYAAAKVALAETSAVEAAAKVVLSRSTIVESSRAAAVRQYGLKIPKASGDKTLGDLLRRAQMLYVRDELGQRADAFDQKVRDIVASGLERGLGRVDIASELSDKLSTGMVGRSKRYWETVAGDFANKARSASQIYSMDEAGVEIYTFSAVLDEVTCNRCGLLDGKSWSVPAVKRQLDYALHLDNPESIKDKRPFLLSNSNGDVYFERHGERYLVAQNGKQLMSDEALLAAGVTLPPLHWRCRCTIVAG